MEFHSVFATGGHAKHVETGQFTPPSAHSSEASDSQNHSLRVIAEGHDQVIKNSCGRVDTVVVVLGHILEIKYKGSRI